MGLVTRTTVCLQRVVRIASVLLPVLAVAMVVVSGGHAQPDLGKWH